MFTIFDIIIIAVIAISAIFGLYGGLIRLSINLIGFLLSIIVAFYLYPFARDILANHLKNEVIMVILAGISAYVISLISFSFLINKVMLIVSDLSGGIIDRFLGLLAGLIRGAVIDLILFLIIAVFTSGSYLTANTMHDIFQETKMDKYPEWLKKSITTEYLDSTTRNIVLMFSEESLKSIELPKKKNINDTLDIMKEKRKLDKEQNIEEDAISNKDLEDELDEMLK